MAYGESAGGEKEAFKGRTEHGTGNHQLYYIYRNRISADIPSDPLCRAADASERNIDGVHAQRRG